MASLKRAVRFVPTLIPVDPLDGTTVFTVGGKVMVMDEFKLVETLPAASLAQA
jgi:hypothetical protein